MIDRFDAARFEAALPAGHWRFFGIVDGERCYGVDVKPGVLIYVRSTIQADGLAADTAKDSIRCWLADVKGASLSSKNSRWISRVSGWERRLTGTLRVLWYYGHQLQPCNWCGRMMSAFKTKSGTHAGRWFAKCVDCGKFDEWLVNPPEEK